MLHIADGESVAGTLRESGLPGVVSTCGDLLYEGPAPAGLDAGKEDTANSVPGANKHDLRGLRMQHQGRPYRVLYGLPLAGTPF